MKIFPLRYFLFKILFVCLYKQIQTINMEALIKSKPVRPKLMKLDVGDSTNYPSSQRDSVTSTRDQLQAKHPGMRWVLSKVDSGTFKITRTA